MVLDKIFPRLSLIVHLYEENKLMVGSGEGSVLFTTFKELIASNGAQAAIVPIVKSIRASG